MNKKHLTKACKTKVGENILYWRKLKGLKQEDLAARVGISTAALSHIENGISKPHIGRMEEIADALQIEVAQLLHNPQQLFNNSLACNGAGNGTHALTNFERDLLQRFTAAMEKIAIHFISDRRSV
jgi:transcriptional regulator with XRE-family HTH domain